MNENVERKSTSRITVLIPAYNASKYIDIAIRSILDQTYSDFLLLVINDGSTDDTEKKILSFDDKRIRYVKNETNIGLVNTLNKGIDLTETEYLVRMDADDISVPQRLEWQLLYMDTHPAIGISGGKYEIVGDESGIPKIPLENDYIKANLLFSNSLCHPTVILRTQILKENDFRFGAFEFNDQYGFKVTEIEDYVMWQRVRDSVQFANLDKILLKYRKEGQNFSTANIDAILARKKMFYIHMLEELKIKPSPLNLLMHINSENVGNSDSANDIDLFDNYLTEILNKNKVENIYPQNTLQEIVRAKWEQLFFYLPDLGFSYVLRYWRCSRKIKGKEMAYFLKCKINNFLKEKTTK
ncbi:MAG: glycosyltransferase family 2 protein [Nitrosopumilus sp.]|nr:glycosyltransferase family 2 protein [Nitrosopumilus sp.]